MVAPKMYVLAVSCLMLLGLTLAMQDPSLVDTPGPAGNVTVTTEAATTPIQVEVVGTNCTTGKDVPGTCVRRQSCGFSTAAIDFTLYRPRGTKNPCRDEETCCPGEFLIDSSKGSKEVAPEDNFDFDDDD